MLKRPVLAAVVCAAILFLCAHTHAALMISYTTNGSAYNVEANVGETVKVSIYLRQSGDTSGDKSILTTDGLFSGGVQIDYTATSGGRADISSMALASHWDDAGSLKKGFDNSVGKSAMAGAVVDDDAVTKGNPILIGTIDFLCDEVGVTQISSGDVVWKDPVKFNFTLDTVIVGGNGPALDPDVFGSDNSIHTLGTITTVPEPSTIVLMALGFGAICAFGIFRRRKLQS